MLSSGSSGPTISAGPTTKRHRATISFISQLSSGSYERLLDVWLPNAASAQVMALGIRPRERSLS